MKPKRAESLWPKLPVWKQIVLSTDAWPTDLVVPEAVRVPAGAGVPLGGADGNCNWQWELRSCPPKGKYVLRVWPYGFAGAHTDNRKGAHLTVKEAWEFALTNSMPHCLLGKIGLYNEAKEQRRRISHELR